MLLAGVLAAIRQLHICETCFALSGACAVQPQHWMPLLIDGVSASTAAPSQLTGSLVILAAAVHAAYKASKPVEGELLQRMAAWLASPDVRALHAAAMQRQLAMVVANLVDAAGPAAQHVAEPLLHVLLHLEGSLKHDAYALEQAQQVLLDSARCAAAGR